MTEDKIQYVSDASGNAVAVIVPIELWQEIESEKETAYLLKSETMRRRLLEADSAGRISRWRKHVRKLVFELAALEDLAWWVEQDRRKALRVLELIEEVHRDPFRGKGKPEPLKHELAGCWSGHRLGASPRLPSRRKQNQDSGVSLPLLNDWEKKGRGKPLPRQP